MNMLDVDQPLMDVSGRVPGLHLLLQVPPDFARSTWPGPVVPFVEGSCDVKNPWEDDG